MRWGVIVLAEPRVDDDTGLVDTCKPLSIQHLAAQRSIEPFVISILPWWARIDLGAGLSPGSIDPIVRRSSSALLAYQHVGEATDKSSMPPDGQSSL